MQNTTTKIESAASELKDPRLFREACYLDGQWVQGSSGQSKLREWRKISNGFRLFNFPARIHRNLKYSQLANYSR